MPKLNNSKELLKTLSTEVSNKIIDYRLKLYNDNKNYTLGNHLDLSMNQEFLNALYSDANLSPDLADYMTFGPYTAKEIFKGLQINYNKLSPEDKLVNLSFLTDLCAEKGLAVSLYYPDPQNNGRVKEKNFNVLIPKPEMEFSKWDNFWKFFGITTEHAKTVAEFNAQCEEAENKAKENAASMIKLYHSKKEELAQGKVIVENLLKANSNRIKNNHSLICGKKAETDKVLSEFFNVGEAKLEELKDARITTPDNKTISAFTYITARTLAVKNVNISNGTGTLTKEEKHAIGNEFIEILNLKDSVAMSDALKNKLTLSNDAICLPEAGLSKHTPAYDLGKKAPYLQAKQELNRFFDGKHPAFAKNSDMVSTFNNRCKRAESETEVENLVIKGEYEKAKIVMKNIINGQARDKVVESIKNQSETFIKKHTAMSSVYKKVSDGIDKKIDAIGNSAETATTLFNVLLKDKESEIFVFKPVIKSVQVVDKKTSRTVTTEAISFDKKVNAKNLSTFKTAAPIIEEPELENEID